MNARSLHHPHPLAPREIETRLGQLIRGYLQLRSTAMAMAVAQHIEALCAHPDYRGSWEERCAYRRLARHWNGLAWFVASATHEYESP
jgi:hypothetical protein